MTPDERPTESTPESDDESWPIGFMIIVTLVVLYLGWRAIQSIGWLIDNV